MAQQTTDDAPRSAAETSVEETAAEAGLVVITQDDREMVTTRSSSSHSSTTATLTRSKKAAAAAAAQTQPEDSSNINDKDEEDDTENQAQEEEEEKKDETETQTSSSSPRKKKDYSDWPLKGIREPHPNDVLFGRGGGTNHHPGNKRYRKMVEDRKVDYINSKRLDKPLVALGIIKEWRGQEPPGRFLKIDDKTGLYNDVGDKKAREKTSQALREKAPIIRKQQEDEERAEERKKKGLPPEESDDETMEPLKDAAPAPDRPKPVMARDTTFGVEYIDPDQSVTLDGFSWQEGIGDAQRHSSGSMRPTPPPPPAHQYAHARREGSYSSVGVPYPPPPAHSPVHYRYGSHGSMPPPPQPSGSFSTPTASMDERHYQQYSPHGRYESWGSIPPPPPQPGYVRPIGSWGERDHSLGQFALPHASIGHPASYATFDPRAYPHGAPPSPYPPAYAFSGGYPGSRPTSYGPPAPPPHQQSHVPPPPPPPPTHAKAGSPQRYSIDASVASTWSGQPEGEIIKTLSGEEAERDDSPVAVAVPTHRPSGSFSRPMLGVKPDIVKRATSNQNENPETKPDLIGGTVKRAALNRDSSNAANRLKELCFPDQFKNGKFDVAKKVNELSADMGRSTLKHQSPERVSTMDSLPPIQGSNSEDTASPQPAKSVRPSAMTERTTSMEAIAASLDDPIEMGTLDRFESKGTDVDNFLSKPGMLGYNDRLTTTDFMQMVNEPIPDDEPELTSGRRQAL